MDQLKPLGIALVWLGLFAMIGLGVTIGLGALLPSIGGPLWWLARDGTFRLLGFAIATIIVGKLLDRHSWSRLGWRAPRTFPPGTFGAR